MDRDQAANGLLVLVSVVVAGSTDGPARWLAAAAAVVAGATGLLREVRARRT